MKTHGLPLLVVAVITVAVGGAFVANCHRGPAASAAEPMAAAPVDNGPAAGDKPAGIAWVKGLAEGEKQAAAQKKPLMVDVYTEGCPWCQKLDKETYADAKVQAKAKSFVCVKVNAENDGDSVSQYNVEGFPTILFLDASGKELHRVTGYLPAAEFVPEMDKALACGK